MTIRFNTRNSSAAVATGLGMFMKHFAESHDRNTLGLNSDVGRLSMESETLSIEDNSRIETITDNLHSNLLRLATESGLGAGSVQSMAAVGGALAAANIRAYAGADIDGRNVSSGPNFKVVSMPVTDGSYVRPAMEAFDERETRNAMVHTVGYNASAAMQDEFGEAFFRTIVLAPDQAGFTAAIDLIEVGRRTTHKANGEIADFGRRNLIQAAIDETILADDVTDVVPVFRDSGPSANTQFFAPAARVAPRVVSVEGEDVLTSPLVLGTKFSLAGLSQTDAQLARGGRNQTDALDSSIYLKNLYLQLQNAAGAVFEVISFPVRSMRGAAANYKVQGNYRDMTFGFEGQLAIGADTKTVAGAASTLLNTAVVVPNLIVKLGVRVAGDINLEFTSGTLFAPEIVVESVTLATGEEATTVQKTAVKAALAGAKLAYFDLEARFTNSNRRETGDIITRNRYVQFYPVPLRAPVTLQRPVNSSDQQDAADIASLAATTRTRASQAAVKAIANFASLLSQVKTDEATIGMDPEALGPANRLVRAYYEYAVIDAERDLQSVSTLDRAREVNALIVNKLRDMVYRAYRVSGYKAAADILAGGQSELPVIVIGADLEITRWLMLDGEFATMGRNFNVKVVGSNARKMKGKIYATFDQPGAVEGAYNPLSFGHMAFRPECVIALPITRDGGNVRELTVSPSYLHIPNMPILLELDISGISDVIASKVAVPTKEQP